MTQQPRKRYGMGISPRSINLRMHDIAVAQLDTLCKTNKRSRRDIVEILVREAFAELKASPEARITP